MTDQSLGTDTLFYARKDKDEEMSHAKQLFIWTWWDRAETGMMNINVRYSERQHNGG